MIVLNRFKTSSKSCLHLLHECGSTERNWFTDPLHCMADMLARGGIASTVLFPSYSNSDNYVDMVNSKLKEIFSSFSDDELDECDISREALNGVTSHGIRTGAMINADLNRGIKKEWTELRAGISKERVRTVDKSYIRLVNPIDLRVARANLDWPDIENGGYSPIFNQTIPLEDQENFKRFVDILYSGSVKNPKLRLFFGIALLLDYESVNIRHPGSQSYLIYTVNQLNLGSEYVLKWSQLIRRRFFDINEHFLVVKINNNNNQQQVNEQFSQKLQYLIDGQQKLLDAQSKLHDVHQSMPAAVVRSVMESMGTVNVQASNRPEATHPRVLRQMFITPTRSSGGRLDQSSPSQVQLAMKGITIAAAIEYYYTREYHNSHVSMHNNNSSTKPTLNKMRRLINAIHYLAGDAINLLSWCKTSARLRGPDWEVEMARHSLRLQDVAAAKLRSYGIKPNLKGPSFWNTYKVFGEKAVYDLSDNYYA